MPDGPTATSLGAGVDRWRLRSALIRKEWQEQRWRFVLGTVVVTALLAGMLRAQIIPPGETSVLIYWMTGVVVVIFLAMAPVAGERADGTWAFLTAQPVPRSEVLIAKWGMGLIHLLGMMIVATVAGVLALWSRGHRGQLLAYESLLPFSLSAGSEGLYRWACQHPSVWLCLLAAVATVSLASWYTPLFFILTRARNEFTAALGGILLTLVLHLWLIQFVFFLDVPRIWRLPVALNPLGPLVLVLSRKVFGPAGFWWLLLMMGVQVGLWIVVPLMIVRRVTGRAPKQ